MTKPMMGPEYGPKAVFGSAKAGETMRKRNGSIKTTKLPTSIDELRDISSLTNDAGPRASTGRAPDS